MGLVVAVLGVVVAVVLDDVVTEVVALSERTIATAAADEVVDVAEPRLGASPKVKRAPFCSTSQ